MPILPILENAAFDPALTKLMGDAFDRAIALLSFVPAKIVQEAMANRIIEAVHEGERSVDRLRDVAVAGIV
jgi:hypothetical protein